MLTIGDFRSYADEDDRLIVWEPPGSRRCVRKRELIVTKVLDDKLNGDWDLAPWETDERLALKRRSQMHGVLLRWIGGIKMVPNEDLKPLKPPPHDVWEFRANEPAPGSRVFGFLAVPGVFVGLAYRRRDQLTGKNSKESRLLFQHAMEEADAEWKAIFPYCTPLSAPATDAMSRGEFVNLCTVQP